jgi:cytoskeletal protein RodZ
MTTSKTIGKIIRAKRESLGLTHTQITEELKIKRKYLEFIENDQFDSFYSKAQAKGFLRNYAKLLELNDDQLIAMYRRDVENLDMKRKITLVEDEDVEEKEPTQFELFLERLNAIKITRKRIAITSVLIIASFLGIYLFRTIQKTFDRPDLFVTSPFEIEAPFDGSLAYDKNSIIISGKTEEGVNITVNGVPVFLNPLFEFSSEIIPTADEETPIVVKAENAIGSSSEITLRLKKDSIKFDKLDAFISVSNASTTLVVKADEAIIFEGVALEGDSFPLEANTEISIETNKPENISLQINGDSYELEGGSAVYRLEEGQVVLE